MAEGLRSDHGGIAGLRELIRQHREAIEFDLITLGLRIDWLGSEHLSWRDLLVIVHRLPASSALARAIDPEASEWGLTEYLLAGVFDAIKEGNWQRSGDSRQQRPEPWPRPGIAPTTHRGDALPLDDMATWLGWN